ncbi:MAG: hypothetical protein R3D45_13250 [Rhizobiaceae bacterium]
MTAVVMLRPAVIESREWRATVTPLASIIGSGFLVAGPILGHAAGNLAWLAMFGLCAAAYLFGAAIRHNIAVVEPMLEQKPAIAVDLIERGSGAALAVAYFISVTYYLNLFAAFGLRGIGVMDANATRIVSTVTIVALGLYGARRGLAALEGVEELAVGIKLGMIAGLISGLLLAAIVAFSGGTMALHQPEHATGAHEIAILLGLVILVQGFETSRYLDDAYDRATRIRTMRNAQLLSSLIYLAFIALITPYFGDKVPVEGGETAIIDMLAPLGALVAPLIIVAALASQLSAAVADMSGAGGLISNITGRRVAVPAGYLLAATVAVAITWFANIYEIIVYASKAFVLYYGMQSLQASYTSAAMQPRNMAKALLFGLAALLAAAIFLLGIPADA